MPDPVSADAPRDTGLSANAGERSVLAWLALVLLLAVALRALNLGTQSMWLDELFSRRAALEPTLWGTILSGSIHDMFPPLYPIISHFAVRLPGDAEAAMRLPSAVAGAAAVFVVFAIGRVLHSARVGLVAATLMGCHWFALAYSQEGRPYALLSLFSAQAVYAGLRVVECQRLGVPARRPLVALGAAGSLLCFLHYVGALFFGAEALVLLFWARRQPPSLRGLLLCCTAVGVAYLPWLSVVATQIGRREGTKQPPHLADIVRTHSDLLARHPFWFWTLVVLACSLAWRGRQSPPPTGASDVFRTR
ncbi:MAG TPA: glycosyltransferase family 39 protein, partial [Polyangiales bacterium]